MTPHAFAIGGAGTGKTTWLIDQVKSRAPRVLLADHQRVLALSFMHGARRRLQLALDRSCKDLRATVVTIDAFALALVNRWRASFASTLPISASAVSRDFEPEFFGVYADFDRIVDRAAQLLRSPTVAKIIAAAYPLIVIDEFQDCHGPRLALIQALAAACPLLAAADPFQLLDSTVPGCPSTEWAYEVCSEGRGNTEPLSRVHRTANTAILTAAHSLRSQVAATMPTVPVLCFPNAAPAAYKLVELLHFRKRGETVLQSVALISPSRDAMTEGVIESYTSQAARRGFMPVRWQIEGSADDEVTRLLGGFACSGSDGLDVQTLDKHETDSDTSRRTAADCLRRLARIKGYSRIPAALVTEYVQRTVHSLRAYSPSRSRRVVTTVHQAKNREFEHVVVLWPFRVAPDKEAQRRLLYNGITRAKLSCVVLVQGTVDRVSKCAVLSLLGGARPVFSAPRKPNRRKPVAPG